MDYLSSICFPRMQNYLNGIDPHFISQLSTVVKERFPFVFTGSKSIGIDQSLLQMMVSMSSKSILFGTFSKSVNEVHQIKYSKSMINYLDFAYSSIINKQSIITNEFVLDMFSTFLDRSKYNRIMLSERLLKKLFLQYISDKELYMQQSFQMQYDLGYARDHTHKYSK